MRSTHPRLALPLLAAFLAVPLSLPALAADHAFFHENVMGTSLELRVRAATPEVADRAERVVLAEIDRLSAVVSTYSPDSELNRWRGSGVKAGPKPISADLYAILAAADRWNQASQGAFEPRIQSLTTLWKSAETLGSPPASSEIAAALDRLKSPVWRLDPASKTAELLDNAPFSLDAIAKGIIVGRACDRAYSDVPGVTGLLLNVGGDLRARGDAPWQIGIVSPAHDSESSDPLTALELREASMATSGRSQRGFQVGARRFSHLLDPRTGQPVERIASATVIAPDSGDADALATICNVLEPAESLRLVESIPGADCLIVEADGTTHRSAHWSGRELLALATPIASPAPNEAVADWAEDHEVAIEFEIIKPETEKGRYRRPYIAVWIEDKDEQPVRTLVLWVSQGGAGPFQWLPDLRRWHKADQDRKKYDKLDMVLTLSRPTRPPGKYTVIWDGKDNKKQPLGPGKYTICIDSAREHGSSESIRQELNVGGDTFKVNPEGNAEVSSVSVEYRTKAVKK